MKFGDLPIGAKFRLYRRGKVRTKLSAKTFEADGAVVNGSADAEVFPEDRHIPNEPEEPKTGEELARDMLTRMGVPQAWKIPRERLAELIALIEAKR
jgi:hypothetical protein